MEWFDKAYKDLVRETKEAFRDCEKEHRRANSQHESWLHYRQCRKNKKAMRKELQARAGMKRTEKCKKMMKGHDKRLYNIVDDANQNSSNLDIVALVGNDGSVRSDIKGKKGIAEEWGKELFQKVQKRVDTGDFEPTAYQFDVCHSLSEDITDEEIIKCIDKAKCGKAAGPEDGINAEVYKALKEYLVPPMKDIFNCVMKTEVIPATWRNGTIINLYKCDGSKLCMKNYRGIMLLCILGKLYNSILAGRLTTYCVDQKILNDAQDGFIPKRGTLCWASGAYEMLTKCGDKCDPYMLLVDLSKAFDCIERDAVYKNLRKAGIPRKLVRIIRDMHIKTRARYKINGSHTKYIKTVQGVPQGDPLSPIIFNLVINPLLTELETHGICYIFRGKKKTSQSIMMYADDFACICETKENLQKAINICKRTIDFFNLRANVKKSAVMRFSKNKERKFDHETFTWGHKGTELPFISCENENCRKCLHKASCKSKECEGCKKHDKFYKYLGLKFEPHMNWDLQYEKLVKSRNATFNECKPLYADIYTPPEAKLVIFKAKEESTDKYGCEVSTISEQQKGTLNVLQMKHLKDVLLCHPNSKNSLLRLMTGVQKYETIRIIRTIGLLQKLKSQDTHRGPRKLIQNWEDKYAEWIDDAIEGKPQIKVNVTDDNFGSTNCRKVWRDHWDDIYYMTKRNVRRKWTDIENESLYDKMKDNKTLMTATKAYKQHRKGTDPIIENLSGIELSQFLNIVNGGHPIYWKTFKCPWCGKPGDARHMVETCEKIIVDML